MDEEYQNRPHRISDLKGYILENRPKILCSLLRVIKAYYDLPEDDRPKGPTKGSFEAWASLVGGILLNAGRNDLMGNIDDIKEKDNDREEVIGFARKWFEVFLSHPMTARRVIEKVYGEFHILQKLKVEGDPDFQDVIPHSLFTMLNKEKEVEGKARALGVWLGRHKNVPYGGFRWMSYVDKGKRKPTTWRLEKLTTPMK
jgi:hypothetical protein